MSVFIPKRFAGLSEDEKDSRRDKVADEFGLGSNHKKDWENQVDKDAFSIDQFSDFPYEIDAELIEGAGAWYQKLKREKKLRKKSD